MRRGTRVARGRGEDLEAVHADLAARVDKFEAMRSGGLRKMRVEWKVGKNSASAV